MLILERKADQSIIITSPKGDEIEVQILDTSPSKAKVAVTAPDDYLILRDELCEQS